MCFEVLCKTYWDIALKSAVKGALSSPVVLLLSDGITVNDHISVGGLLKSSWACLNFLNYFHLIICDALSFPFSFYNWTICYYVQLQNYIRFLFFPSNEVVKQKFYFYFLILIPLGNPLYSLDSSFQYSKASVILFCLKFWIPIDLDSYFALFLGTILLICSSPAFLSWLYS